MNPELTNLRIQKPEHSSNLNRLLKSTEFRVGASAVVLGISALALNQCASTNESKANVLEINKPYKSISFNEDSLIRHEPTTLDNVPVDSLGSDTSIVISSDYFVSPDPDNGPWIGVRVEDLPEGINSNNDPDGVVWINSSNQVADDTLEK